MKRILITGASGFVGGKLVKKLALEREFKIYAATRSVAEISDGIDYCLAPDMSKQEMNWDLPDKLDVVVHAAAKAHQNNKHSSKMDFFRINVDATLSLVVKAAEKGVKRFIFLSSIGVNGRCSKKPFKSGDIEAPYNSYSASKFHAEVRLKKLCKELGMELVIIRAPLVYSHDAPGNFSLLLKVLKKNAPLPFGLIKNARNFISLDNLLDFIDLCIKHPLAADQVFLISDNEAVSTPEVLRLLAEGMGKKVILVPVPLIILKLIFSIFGKKDTFRQLNDNLEIDTEKAKTLLGWSPKETAQSALLNTGRNFMRYQVRA